MYSKTVGLVLSFYVGFLRGDRTGDLSTLKQLQIISRHGARTPYGKSYAGDVNTDFLSIGQGQLTKKGSDEMFEYGLNLKKRYGNFLKNDYRTVLARSSYITRCLQSGEATLAAIYPRTYSPPGDEGNKYDNFQSGQAIPIYTACDGMLSAVNFSRLTNLEGLMEQFYSKPFVDEVFKDAKLLPSNTNQTKLELYSMMDSIITEKYHNLILPPWYDAMYPRLQTIQNAIFRFWATNTTYSIPSAGALLKEIVTNWMTPRTSDGTNVPISAFFYFTHDIVVGALLGLLKCPLEEAPPFGATIIIEKHEFPDNSTLVNFLYQNTSSSEPVLLNNKYCDTSVTDFSVDNLIKIYSGILSKL